MHWVERILQQCFLTLASDRKTKCDGDIVKKGKQYLQRVATAARQWLLSHDAKVLVFSENDESDMEE